MKLEDSMKILIKILSKTDNLVSVFEKIEQQIARKKNRTEEKEMDLGSVLTTCSDTKLMQNEEESYDARE